jgi:hypothetical protein
LSGALGKKQERNRSERSRSSAFGESVAMSALKRDPEKARPGLDPGWVPVFRKDQALPKIESAITTRHKAIAL